MKLRSYPLNGKLLKQQKRSAKIYSEEEFSNERDDAFTFSRRSTILSTVDEWVPRDPYCGSPSNEGNISGVMSVNVRDINNGSNGSAQYEHRPTECPEPVDVAPGTDCNNADRMSRNAGQNHPIKG